VKRDRIRRKKVAEIFAQGCLKAADDYYHAATVFQHGELPDHFFYSFIWASQAFKAGKEGAGNMAANGADRYLMNLGFKQLFGGQAVTEKTGKGFEKDCFCLWPIEEGFPEKKRVEFKFRTRQALLDWIKDINKTRDGCENGYCHVDAKPVPKGTVPGLW
jgi:hypothetical protein